MNTTKTPEQTESRHDALLTFGIVAGCAILFSSKGIFIKSAYAHGADSVTVLMLRMILALPFFITAGIWSAKNSSHRMTAQDWRAVIALGFVGYYLSSIMNFAGLQYISAGLERMVLYTYPSLVVIGGALFYKRRISRTTIISIVIAYLGIVIAYWGEGKQSGSPTQTSIGVALIFGSALTYSVFVLTSGYVIKRVGATRFTAYSMGTSCVLAITHYALAHSITDIASISKPVLFYGGVLAIFGTVLPSFMLSTGIKRAGAERFAIIATIGPVMTLILAWAVLGEKLNAPQAIGFALTLGGGLIVSLWGKK
jgi:drug/metabolite transporter (DMT)-like permease